MEILPSARKHGISDDEMRHAAANALATISTPEQPAFVMLVGPTETGQLLEIGLLTDADNDYVIHAMPARSRYLTMIREQRGEP